MSAMSQHPAPETVQIKDEEAPSDAVLRGLELVLDTKIVEMEPLYDVIDPDGLDDIISPGNREGLADIRVKFTYQGVQVVVRGEGSEVELRPPV